MLCERTFQQNISVRQKTKKKTGKKAINTPRRRLSAPACVVVVFSVVVVILLSCKCTQVYVDDIFGVKKKVVSLLLKSLAITQVTNETSE